MHRNSNLPELPNNDKVQIAQVRKTMEIYFLEMTQMWGKSNEMMRFPRMQVYVTPAILGHVTHPSENAHLIYKSFEKSDPILK